MLTRLATAAVKSKCLPAGLQIRSAVQAYFGQKYTTDLIRCAAASWPTSNRSFMTHPSLAHSEKPFGISRAVNDGDDNSRTNDHAHDSDSEHEGDESYVSEDEMVEMVAEGPSGPEWNGPTRAGRYPEPTRFGDWEQKGRCVDF